MIVENLTKYFANWDPMDFINELEAPDDEYQLEAEAIVEKYSKTINDRELSNLVYDTFINLIESDYEGFKEEIIKRVPEIRKILEQ